MKADLDCLACIVGQAVRVATVATSCEKTRRDIVNMVSRHLPELDLTKSPAVLSQYVYETAIELTGVNDPYRDLRYLQNCQALEIEPKLRELVASSHDPLDTALHLAAAGNIIDLGVMRQDHIDVSSAIQEALETRFSVDHSAAFRQSLEHARSLLYLLDNAGEIVFDKILIEELIKHVPVTAVVKGGPIINDVILEDAQQVGLTEVCDVIDNGGPWVGSPLEFIPPSFRTRLDQTDLIIGKGQGNFETLDDFPGDVYLILRAKCPIVAKNMGVELGQIGLIGTRFRSRNQAS